MICVIFSKSEFSELEKIRVRILWSRSCVNLAKSKNARNRCLATLAGLRRGTRERCLRRQQWRETDWTLHPGAALHWCKEVDLSLLAGCVYVPWVT